MGVIIDSPYVGVHYGVPIRGGSLYSPHTWGFSMESPYVGVRYRVPIHGGSCPPYVGVHYRVPIRGGVPSIESPYVGFSI